MAFIKYYPPLDPNESDDSNALGSVEDNILRIHGVHPKTLRLHYDLYVELMRGEGPLSIAQRELIGVQVSVINGCHY